MRHIKPPSIRNKIEFSDANQLRVMKKRLGVSDGEFTAHCREGR